MKNVIISPSILNCDYLRLDDEINKIIQVGATWIHLDIMDGDFVPNYGVNDSVLGRISSNKNLIKDVHIMVSEPLKYIEKYTNKGINYLTFHQEACDSEEEINKIINLVHSYEMKVGLSIKPDTPVEVLFPFLDKLDLVLVMSVMPGKGGQNFIDESLKRITALKKEIGNKKLQTLISVDGGINDKVAPLCIESGADVLVVGSYLFKNKDFVSAYQKLLK